MPGTRSRRLYAAGLGETKSITPHDRFFSYSRQPEFSSGYWATAFNRSAPSLDSSSSCFLARQKFWILRSYSVTKSGQSDASISDQFNVLHDQFLQPLLVEDSLIIFLFFLNLRLRNWSFSIKIISSQPKKSSKQGETKYNSLDRAKVK